MTTTSVTICEISDINSKSAISDVVAVKDTTKISINPVYVINILNHLREIDNIIKDGTNQSGKALEKIPMIADCIQTLDSQRFHFHEELEKETINRFVLQHCLINLPRNIQNEINAAVEAVKKQNEAITKSNAEEIADLEENICKVREEQLRLEKENNILLPQRNEIRKSHDRCLLDLNKCLAQKSELQILLNETREKTSLRNQEIVQTEVDIVELKKVLAKEWEEANKKIKECKIDIENTEKYLKLMLSRDESTKKEEVKLMEEMLASNLLHQDIQTNEKSLNKEVVLKKKDNHKLRLELNAELKLEEELLSKKKKLSQQHLKLTKKADSCISEKKKILTEMNMKHQYEMNRSVQLKQQFQDQKEELIVMKEAERMSEVELETVKNIFESNQDDYKSQTAILRNLEKSNREITQAMQRAKISNSLTVAHLNQEIEKNVRKLEEEKQFRQDIQQENKDLCVEINITKVRQREYVAGMKRKIVNLKEQQTDKKKMAENLGNDVEELNIKIQTSEEEINSEKVEFTALIEQKQEKIKETQKTISELEETVKQKTAIVEKMTPEFEEMEKQFQQKTDIFNECKNTFTVTRRTDIALINDIKKMEQSLTETKAPLIERRNKIKEAREEYLRLLSSQSQESKTTEEEIYIESCKLKILIEENNRLKQDTLTKERESESIRMSGKKLEKILLQLTKDLLNAKDELSKDFITMSNMQERIQKRDQMTVKQMDISQNIIDANVKIVSNVTKQVYQQLEIFGIYLKEAELRRPD